MKDDERSGREADMKEGGKGRKRRVVKKADERRKEGKGENSNKERW